ncbi:MAG: hypothetical protein ABR970_11770 [Roseiarcus sp.]
MEILFGIEDGEIAIARGDQTHIAGCAYRAPACVAQTLFAVNERCLINEKGAPDEAARFPSTIPDLPDRRDRRPGLGPVRVCPPVRPLRFPYAPPCDPEWIAYGLPEHNWASFRRLCAMADVIYLVLGLAFFGLMGLYAVACGRL